MFLWIKRTPFCRPCRNFFDKCPNSSRARSPNNPKTMVFLENVFPSKSSSGLLESSFDITALVFSPEVSKTFTKIPKKS